GQAQFFRVGGVCHQSGDVGPVALVLDIRQLAGVDFHHHRPPSQAVEGGADPVPGFAVAAHQIEGFLQVAHLAAKLAVEDGLAQVVVLGESQQGGDENGPANHRQVNTENHPQSLLFREGFGDLAKADGGGGETDEVEGVEEAYSGGLTVVPHRPGNQGQAEHPDRENHNQGDQGAPQAPEDQKDGADVAFPGHGAGSLAALHDGFGNEKGHRYHVGEQCATGQGDHAGGVLRCHPGTADVNRIAPHHGRRQQLQVGHQAGGQVDGADLGAVPQLEDGGDQADDDGGEQLVDI